MFKRLFGSRKTEPPTDPSPSNSAKHLDLEALREEYKQRKRTMPAKDFDTWVEKEYRGAIRRQQREIVARMGPHVIERIEEQRQFHESLGLPLDDVLENLRDDIIDGLKDLGDPFEDDDVAELRRQLYEAHGIPED